MFNKLSVGSVIEVADTDVRKVKAIVTKLHKDGEETYAVDARDTGGDYAVHQYVDGDIEELDLKVIRY